MHDRDSKFSEPFDQALRRPACGSSVPRAQHGRVDRRKCSGVFYRVPGTAGSADGRASMTVIAQSFRSAL